MLISSLFHVDQDLFLNFLSSSSGFVTPTKNKLLKWGPKTRQGGPRTRQSTVFTESEADPIEIPQNSCGFSGSEHQLATSKNLRR